MKIYIAGKITGNDRKETVLKFEAAAKKLIESGHEVFIPCVLPDYPDVSHNDYLHICFAIIDIVDAVYMLKDWQDSIGARSELQHAFDIKKTILYENEATREKNFPRLNN